MSVHEVGDRLRRDAADHHPTEVEVIEEGVPFERQGLGDLLLLSPQLDEPIVVDVLPRDLIVGQAGLLDPRIAVRSPPRSVVTQDDSHVGKWLRRE